MRPIIALCGVAGSGKSTAAERLFLEHNFRRVRFSGPLKDMMRALGLTEREIEGDMKEKPSILLGGKTPREAMQTLGTEWGRQMVDPTIWIRAWRKAVNIAPEGIGVVAEDCRYPNEAAAAREASPFALVIRIVRPQTIAVRSHVSELQAFPADITIMNDGTISDLRAKIDELVVSRMNAVPAM